MSPERVYQVIRRPIISEKSTRVAERHNQIMFEVDRKATKIEIREAIEKIYGVRVLSVQVANRKGKTKRFRNSLGARSDQRKAFVRLQAGDDIDFSVEANL